MRGSRAQARGSTDTEPDGILRKACGNRREAVCPPCAERYRQDAYHLIAAGLRGGKGVPDSVTENPAVLVTLTAPTFELVHTRALGADGQPRRCRPRRDAPTCEHGVRLSCARVHDDDDPCLGEPLRPDCFDHKSAVAWNNALGELWRRTTIFLPRVIARHSGMTQKRLRELVRASYPKVAEYQRRGLVHLHVVIRLDRAMPAYRRGEIHPPSGRFGIELLEDAIRATGAEVHAPLPDEVGGGEVRWGDELDERRLDASERGRIARTPAEPTLDTGETIALADVKVIASAEPPRRDRRDGGWRACAHQLGYRGHCLTKSRHYSTTFTALRQAREQHVHQQVLARSDERHMRSPARPNGSRAFDTSSRGIS